MEQDVQKLKCIQENTGTISKFLIVLTSLYFFFPFNQFVCLISTTSAFVLGSYVKNFRSVMLASVMFLHLIVFDFSTFITAPITARFYTLAASLIAGYYVLREKGNEIFSLIFATSVTTLSLIPPFLSALGSSLKIACFVVYPYMLIASWVFGVYFVDIFLFC